MDWNKSNTILIVAFIIVNIFLMVVAAADVFDSGAASGTDDKYLSEVSDILAEKNIVIACDIPEEIYTVPFLDAEFDIIEPRTVLLRKFLGPDTEPVEGVYRYENNAGEILEIRENKKIRYEREKIVTGHVDGSTAGIMIESFVNEKNIDISDFHETERYTGPDYIRVTMNQYFEELPLENSYMTFYVDSQHVYAYETQHIKEDGVTIKGRVSSGNAVGCLLRIMTYDDVSDKSITGIKMTYYCDERGDWSVKTSANAYPVWKVMFDDGNYLCLPADD